MLMKRYKKESKAQSAKEKEPFTLPSPLLVLALNYTNQLTGNR